jgi:antitoxin VapB
MSINIKNPRVHELARQAAALTGQSQTSVIETALERLLAELQTADTIESRGARIDHILADAHRRARITEGDGITVEDLYDDAGLPR